MSATRRGSVLDYLGMGGAVLGQAVPGFWLGLMLIYVFSVRLGWLPTGGTGGLAHYVMPSIVLAAFFAARMARLTRSSVLETIGEDYIAHRPRQGTRPSGVVIAKHTLKNSAIPIVTLAGLETGQLLGGAVITETIFAWPGLGRLTVQALLNRDFPVVLAAVFVISLTYTLINFARGPPLRLARSADAAGGERREAGRASAPRARGPRPRPRRRGAGGGGRRPVARAARSRGAATSPRA